MPKAKKAMKMALSSKEVERIRKELAKVDALKEALGLKTGSDNPRAETLPTSLSWCI